MEKPFTPLPAELRPILLAQGVEPLRLFDDETHKVYVLVETAAPESMTDDDLRRELTQSLEEESRGESAPLDMQAIRNQGMRILEERRARLPS